MSNNNKATKQTTLIPNNQALSSKINQAIQGKSSSRKRPSGSSSRTPSKKPPQIRQVINLQQSPQSFNPLFIQSQNQQQFIAELAKKCGSFFNWINQIDTKIFAEQIWKNKMMKVVGQRYPQLNTDEQQKLIERDWKIMAPQRKEQILNKINEQVDYQELNKLVNENFDNQRNQIYLQFNGNQHSQLVEVQKNQNGMMNEQ